MTVYDPVSEPVFAPVSGIRGASAGGGPGPGPNDVVANGDPVTADGDQVTATP